PLQLQTGRFASRRKRLMNTSRPFHGRASERGEGYVRLVIFLVVLVIVAYIGFQNIPTYFTVQNLKHDLAEVIRGLGTNPNTPIEQVQKAVNRVAAQYGTDPGDIKLEKSGKVLTATLNTTKHVDLIVTTYDWQINEVFSQTGY